MDKTSWSYSKSPVPYISRSRSVTQDPAFLPLDAHGVGAVQILNGKKTGIWIHIGPYQDPHHLVQYRSYSIISKGLFICSVCYSTEPEGRILRNTKYEDFYHSVFQFRNPISLELDPQHTIQVVPLDASAVEDGYNDTAQDDETAQNHSYTKKDLPC